LRMLCFSVFRQLPALAGFGPAGVTRQFGDKELLQHAF